MFPLCALLAPFLSDGTGLVVSDEVGQVYVFGTGGACQWAQVHMDQVRSLEFQRI